MRFFLVKLAQKNKININSFVNFYDSIQHEFSLGGLTSLYLKTHINTRSDELALDFVWTGVINDYTKILARKNLGLINDFAKAIANFKTFYESFTRDESKIYTVSDLVILHNKLRHI